MVEVEEFWLKMKRFLFFIFVFDKESPMLSSVYLEENSGGIRGLKTECFE